ncbi:hypothetical protein [Legionella cherrii]|uniref:Capsule polysaccharide biosynthesis protein n=1 Tax=Legionella cherrii TaxID=28084 RepID=A0A0W0SHC0_9GAMM|nr:hypothetical protein [Legionella cherrii]KTC82587.1 Capsule polysaccharide biosynthesis protein [Legionella cherrii]VEB35321.1 Capsule polysaccharide biosynthesis protein [Legionella cherrii]
MEKLKILFIKGDYLNKIGKDVGDILVVEDSLFKVIIFCITTYGFIKTISRLFFYTKNIKNQSLYSNNIMRRLIRVPHFFRIPLIGKIYQTMKNVHCHFLLLYFESLLKKNKPDCVFVWNGSLMPESVLISAAKRQNIKIIYFEFGFFPGTLQVDAMGINGNNSVVKKPEFYLNQSFSDTILPTELNVRKSKHRSDSRHTVKEDYIFVPFQVPSDMQILNLSPWIKSMVDFYEVIYELAQKFPNERFVIKEHPSFSLSIINKVKKHHNIYFANSENTRNLIEKAKFIITINSTVGIESILLGKKVISLGIACYNIEGLVLHSDNMQALISCIKDIDKWQYNDELRSNFLKYIYQHYLLQGNLNNIDEQFIENIRRRVTKTDAHSQFITYFEKEAELPSFTGAN